MVCKETTDPRHLHCLTTLPQELRPNASVPSLQQTSLDEIPCPCGGTGHCPPSQTPPQAPVCTYAGLFGHLSQREKAHTAGLLPCALPSLWLFTDRRSAAVGATLAAVCPGTEPAPTPPGAAARRGPAPRATAGPERSCPVHPNARLFQLGVRAGSLGAGSSTRAPAPSAGVESQEEPGCPGKAAAASAAPARSAEEYWGGKAALLRVAFCREKQLHDTRSGCFYLCQGHGWQKAALRKRGAGILSHQRRPAPLSRLTPGKVPGEPGITQPLKGCRERRGTPRGGFDPFAEICALLTLNCIKHKRVQKLLLQMNSFHRHCIQLQISKARVPTSFFSN